MKTNRLSLLSLVFVLLSAGLASAQWSVGVRGGGYAGTITQPELISKFTPDMHWSPGLSIGVFAERALSPNVSIRPELVYQQKGFLMRAGTSVKVGPVPLRLGVKSAYKVSYAEMPVLLKLSTGGDIAKVYLIAGPSVGYALDAQLITRPQAIVEFRPVKVDVPLSTLGYNKFELSGIAGAGISFKAGVGQFMAEARYQHGISRLIDVPVVRANVRNQGVSVSLGYMVAF